MKNKWIRWKLWFILFIFLIDICARNGVAQFWGEEEKPEKERDRETETEKEKEKEKNGWIKKLQCRRRMQIPNETLRWPKGGFRVVVSMSFVKHAFRKCGETSISTCQQGVESICLSCSYFDFWTGAKWTATEPFNRATAECFGTNVLPCTHVSWNKQTNPIVALPFAHRPAADGVV